MPRTEIGEGTGRGSRPWRGQGRVLAAALIWLTAGGTLAAQDSPPPPAANPDAVAVPTPSTEPLPGNGPAPAPVNSGLFRNSLDEPDAPTEADRHPTDTLAQAQAAQAETDTLARLTFQRAQTNSEVLFNGSGGVPLALNPLFTVPRIKDAPGFQAGPFTVRPILSTGVSYGTISGNRSQGSSGFYGTLSPAFTATLGEPATGRTLTLVYTGTLSYGSDSAGRSPYTQDLSLNGTLNFTKLNLGAGLDYTELSSSNRDFGGENVNSNILGASLNAGYTYSEKTSFSTALTAPVRLFNQGYSSEGVTSTSFINYNYSPLTTVGLGFGIGTLEVQGENSQVFEQALSRLSYILTERLTFNGTLGCEFRDAGSKEEITPVFGFGLTWLLREGTTLMASAERRIENSAATAETNYTDTDFSFSLTQRLGDFVQATGVVGYENAAYDGVESDVSSSREDNQFILQGSLSYRFEDRWIFTATISYSKDFSNEDAFTSLQDSLQLTYVF